MREPVHYISFFGPRSTGLDGQQNLSRPMRDVLGAAFDLQDLSPEGDGHATFPRLSSVINALHRLLARRVRKNRQPRGISVIDLIHGVVAVPKERAGDRFIVIGHDSYALRTLRELDATHGFTRRARLSLSYLGWLYAEFLLRRLAWRSLFVSERDRRHAGKMQVSDVVSIPLSDTILAARTTHSDRASAPQAVQSNQTRILVPLPVLNQTQNRIDMEFVERLQNLAGDRATITLWGAGADHVASQLRSPQSVCVVDWTEDYIGFLRGFDVLVYPRMIGSGFHTKIAEALALNLPCLCADWVAEPLREAGYSGLTSFSDPDHFEQQARARLDQLNAGSNTCLDVPDAAHADVALAPLIHACREARIP